jgi:hypothetical protein
LIKQRRLPTRRAVNAHPAPDLVEAVAVTRFWRMVQMGDDSQCWLWTGDQDGKGYGIFTYRGRRRPAHEMARSFTVGEVRPDGFDTCHSCDTPLCCNPHHLRFDTRQSNVDDMFERGRAPIGEANKSAKLTNAIVREIRERRAAGARQVDLAEQYGVSPAYISDIVNGLVWQDAGGPITGKSRRTKRYKNSTRGKAA